jgi:hypothetical protein
MTGDEMTTQQAEAARAALNDPAVQETLSEADQMEIEKLKNNAEISAIIKSGKETADAIEISGVKVRFAPFISRTVRHKISTMPEAKTLEEGEEIIYKTLALLCKDDPYNKAATWKFIEANGGDASEILTQIMRKISERAKQMRAFQ